MKLSKMSLSPLVLLLARNKKSKPPEWQHFRAYMLGLKQFKSADSITHIAGSTDKNILPVWQHFFAKFDINEELQWDDIFIHKYRFFTKCIVIGSEEFTREKINKFSGLMYWKGAKHPRFSFLSRFVMSPIPRMPGAESTHSNQNDEGQSPSK